MIPIQAGKKLPAMLLCTAALLLLSVNLQAQKIQVRVLVTRANIRLEPNTESSIITSVPRGAVLESDERLENWYRVYLPPNAAGVVVSGYIHINLVEPLVTRPVEPEKQRIEEAAPKQEVRVPVTRPRPSPGARAAGMIRGYGFKFGPNLANWYGRDVREGSADLKMKTGLLTGGFITFNIYRMFGFQPEILFTQKGTKVEFLGYTLKDVTNYIEIPLLIKASPAPLGTGISPIFYFGPSIAFNIRGQAILKAGGEKEKSKIEDLKPIDIGLVYGTGIHYQPPLEGFFGKTELILEIRYTLGLTTISDLTDTVIRNGVFSLLFGLFF